MTSEPHTGTPNGRVMIRDLIKTVEEIMAECDSSYRAFGNEGMRRRADHLDATRNLLLAIVHNGGISRPSYSTNKWGRR